MKTRLPLIILPIFAMIIMLACATPQFLSNTKATDTPVSTPTPIPGWSEFTAENISLWLPDSFEGGDIKNDLDVVVGNLRSLGPDYEQIASMIESNPSVFLIWAFDSNLGPGGFLTNVNMTHEQVLSTVTTDVYAEAMSKQLPASFTISSQNKVQLGQNEATQLLVDMNESGITAKQVVYIIKNDNTIYCLTYSTSSDEFEDRFPVFKQSANTFTITP